MSGNATSGYGLRALSQSIRILCMPPLPLYVCWPECFGGHLKSLQEKKCVGKRTYPANIQGFQRSWCLLETGARFEEAESFVFDLEPMYDVSVEDANVDVDAVSDVANVVGVFVLVHLQTNAELWLRKGRVTARERSTLFRCSWHTSGSFFHPIYFYNGTVSFCGT